LKGSGNEGLLHDLRNSRSARPLYKDLELSVCTGVFLSRNENSLLEMTARLAQQFFNEKLILSTISTPRKAPPVTCSDSESQDVTINDETNKLAFPSHH
jgi:hypothetical protein